MQTKGQTVGEGPDIEPGYDVLVVGSGAAGIVTALTAESRSARVLVVDAAEYLGGTSAISGGWLYLPGSRYGREAGDDREAAETYLKALAGDYVDEVRLNAFLDSVDETLAFLENKTYMEIAVPDFAPDYEQDQPGSVISGRAMFTKPFDARKLGDYRRKLRPALRELSVFGFQPQIGTELQHFVNANRSVRSFLFAARRLLITWYERLRHGRGLRLSNGNGMMGALIATAADRGIEMRTDTRVTKLLSTDGVVTGAELTTPDGTETIRVTRGVVLACGGFSHSEDLRNLHFPDLGDYSHHASPVTAEHTGEAARLAGPVGGHFDAGVSQPTAWTPVTMFGKNGQRLFPHLRTIGMPGIIAINHDGVRFVNESNSYHAFGKALLASSSDRERVEAFLVCDARTMRRYGLGYAKPLPVPRFSYFRNGYLIKGGTLQELAEKLDIDPQRLVETVRDWNRHARVGEDPLFGRGQTAYNRARGDLSHKPNPSIATLERGPFYATRVVLGDLGTYAGMATDTDGQVLTEEGRAIEGLFATGVAAHSVFGGAYPGYGGVLGPAVVSGYRVGKLLGAGQK